MCPLLLDAQRRIKREWTFFTENWFWLTKYQLNCSNHFDPFFFSHLKSCILRPTFGSFFLMETNSVQFSEGSLEVPYNPPPFLGSSNNAWIAGEAYIDRTFPHATLNCFLGWTRGSLISCNIISPDLRPPWIMRTTPGEKEFSWTLSQTSLPPLLSISPPPPKKNKLLFQIRLGSPKFCHSLYMSHFRIFNPLRQWSRMQWLFCNNGY